MTLVLLILLATGLILHGPDILKMRQPQLMLLRGLLAFLAFSSYYIALSVIPLADGAAVFMTAPLFVTALSVYLLAEKVGIHRWAAVCIGFIAILIMLNPGSDLFRIEAAIPLFSALCYAIVPIITRYIGMAVPALTMTIYTTASYLFMCLLTFACLQLLPIDVSNQEDTTMIWHTLLLPWYLPTGADFLLMALSGGIFTLALLAITQAYRIAAVSIVAPFEYSYLIWASLLGYIAFGDIPGLRTVLGGLTIVSCGLYIMYREHRAK